MSLSAGCACAHVITTSLVNGAETSHQRHAARWRPKPLAALSLPGYEETILGASLGLAETPPHKNQLPGHPN